MPSARVNGIELNYHEQGSSLPVLFIDGGFGGPSFTLTDMFSQQPIVHRLLPPDRAHVVTYDRRSSGRSQYVLDDYTLVDLAADAHALLAHLGIDRAVIIGDSMGGMIALQYALAYPPQVIGLALVETGADLISGTAFGSHAREIVARARTEGDRAVFESRKNQLRHPQPIEGFGPSDPASLEAMRAQHEAFVATLAATSDEDLYVYTTGVTRNYAAFIGADFGPRLGELTMPVCIVHGSADPVVPLSYAAALKHGIPHAELHAIPAATHGVLRFPAAGEALRDWVLRIAASTMHWTVD